MQRKRDQIKYISLNDHLYRYLCEHSTGAGDPVLQSLRKETEALGDVWRMQISPEQGTFMTMLVAAIGAKSALEVGTFTGYSAICIARGLSDDGRLVCVDNSEKWTTVARKYLAEAKVQQKIELKLGDAISVLQGLKGSDLFDFAFIDADKAQYDSYYELILPQVRQGGLILFDNMLWGADTSRSGQKQRECLAVDQMNQKLSNDGRVDAVLLPISDGIMMCRKR
jgi:caffeoyl-CoA O-methyltransferase